MVLLGAIILLVLLAVLAVAGLVIAIMWLVKSKQKSMPVDVSAAVPAGSSSKVGVCAMCGESRIIIKPEDGLCASCYSNLRTKKLQ
jgi:hypothetical protein